jgi:hypothetical protein
VLPILKVKPILSAALQKSAPASHPLIQDPVSEPSTGAATTNLHNLNQLIEQQANRSRRHAGQTHLIQQTIDRQELIRLLLESHVPTTHTSGNLNSGNLNHDRAPASDKANRVIDVVERVLMQPSGSGIARQLLPADENLVNLVAWIFDYVLDDDRLPVTFQALIARLQLPILKVALLEPGLFDDPRHPARCLINQIADLAIRWHSDEDDENDPLYRLVLGIIQTTQSESAPTSAFYQTQTRLLDEYIRMESKRTNIIEQRVSQAAHGKARMDRTNRELQAALWQRLHDKQVPEFLGIFIIAHWNRVLAHVLLRYGESTSQWIKAIQVVDDLIWAQQPKLDEKSLQRLQRMTPGLIVRLHTGLKALGQITPESLQLLKKIKELLELQQHRHLFLETRKGFAEIVRHAADQGNPAARHWLQMTALERQQIKHQAMTQTYFQQIQAFKPGQWFLFESPERGRKLRCKLVACLTEDDSYILVNRLGIRVAEFNRATFANYLLEGRIHLLDRTMLFDRAVNSIVSRLMQKSA